jgi:hypothetical protein
MEDVIIKYLTGNMTADEKADFLRRLADDAALRSEVSDCLAVLGICDFNLDSPTDIRNDNADNSLQS